MMLSILDWSATILTLLGMFLIAGRHNIGFFIAAVSSVIWIIVSIYSHLTGLLTVNAILIVFDIYGFYKGIKSVKKDLTM